MDGKVKSYVDSLFADIPDSKQLRELKEEVCTNLLERISDSLGKGNSEEQSFRQAIAELGDVGELAESMRRLSRERIEENLLSSKPLDKKHVLGYVTASAIMLFGILSAGIVFLQTRELFITTSTLLPFIVASAALFVFFGLTQETLHHYAMNSKRALAYTLATVLFLFGIMTSLILYYQGQEAYKVLATLMPFVLPAVVIFIYLGLTEKSRRKIDDEWAKEWMEKWTAEWKHHHTGHYGMIRGGISGALWLFSTAIFLLIGLNGGWKYSWVVFIFAAGVEALIEAIFAYRSKRLIKHQ